MDTQKDLDEFNKILMKTLMVLHGKSGKLGKIIVKNSNSSKSDGQLYPLTAGILL